MKKAGLKKSRSKNAKAHTIELVDPRIEVEFVQSEVKITANQTK
jgi:hypothetical protein